MRTLWRALLVLTGAVLVAAPSAWAEVSVNIDDEGRVSFVEMIFGGGIGQGHDPWPTVRVGIPQHWVLNPDGGQNVPPDGKPSFAFRKDLGTLEVSWARHDGNDYEIVVSRWDVDHWTTPVALTDNDVDDVEPDIVYTAAGRLRISYTSDDWVTVLDQTESGWAEPSSVGPGYGPSTGDTPEPTVAYQYFDAPENLRYLSYGELDDTWHVSIHDGGTMFAGFDGTGDVDVRLHAENDILWMVWESADLLLTWCVLVEQVCSTVEHETLTSVDEEERVRFLIKQKVLGR